jgi:hypothetical protein
MSEVKFFNYRIKNSLGVFVTTVQEPTEGYTENKYVDLETQKEKVNYEKTLDSFSGELIKIVEDETPYGTRLKIMVKEDEGVVNILAIPMVDNKGNISDWVKAFTLVLHGCKKGDKVEFSLNRKSTKEYNGKKLLYKNVYLKVNGEKVEWGFNPQDAPKWQEKEVKKLGKIVKEWDRTANDEFHYEKLQTVLATFEMERVEEAPKVVVEEPKKETISPNNSFEKAKKVVVEDDDVPF